MIHGKKKGKEKGIYIEQNRHIYIRRPKYASQGKRNQKNNCSNPCNAYSNAHKPPTILNLLINKSHSNCHSPSF